MELAAFVANWKSILFVLARAELAKVFGCFRTDVGKEFHLDATRLLPGYCDVEKDLIVVI